MATNAYHYADGCFVASASVPWYDSGQDYVNDAEDWNHFMSLVVVRPPSWVFSKILRQSF